MGIGKSTIDNVTFNHSDAFYYAGENVTGTISFHNAEKKLTLTNVSLGFIGEIGYTGHKTHQSCDSMGNVHTENRVGEHQLPFIHTHIQFTHSKDNENKITLEHGQHSWPFEFTLSDDLPPSSGSLTSSFPYIKYYMRISVTQLWHKFKKTQTFPLIIFPRINILHFNRDKQAIAVYNRNHLHVRARVDRQSILPDESISLDINLNNENRLTIKGIEAILIQKQKIDRNHHSQVIFKEDLPISENFTETQFHEIFDLQKPSTQLPPTYDYTASCSDLSIHTSITYELNIKVKVHEWHNQIDLIIPIVIGTESTLERTLSSQVSYGRISINSARLAREISTPFIFQSRDENMQIQEVKL
ncbi:unnamed protein product [Rotaria sp. Silwood1]|nr:unnamed protein product [Rotaria sp. Silwood1]CAF3759554.1 unnamed protein product [Rotaria sp. Silwood1]CAF3848572.1 unnamed protein product [Rotaria sp. Silwood1]CAF4705133.1 unnamed protein product [Rotaria sp. Silwood1]CAF4870817.1 unnamed protein product [Rotaria sp. Silwood1]